SPPAIITRTITSSRTCRSWCSTPGVDRPYGPIFLALHLCYRQPVTWRSRVGGRRGHVPRRLTCPGLPRAYDCNETRRRTGVGTRCVRCPAQDEPGRERTSLFFGPPCDHRDH